VTRILQRHGLHGKTARPALLPGACYGDGGNITGSSSVSRKQQCCIEPSLIGVALLLLRAQCDESDPRNHACAGGSESFRCALSHNGREQRF